MAELLDLTSMSAVVLPSQGFDDRPLVVVVVAGRFTMPVRGSTAEPTLTEEQPPVPLADEHWGEPGASSLRIEGQGTHVRPGTDIYLEGHAWAPGGRPCERAVVGVAVGPCQRGAVVFGDRMWTEGLMGATPSRPRPFTSMPLVYERCFGGQVERASGAVARASEYNPVGRGLFARERDAIGQPLPNLEDPRALIASVSDRPLPAGFGPIARHWRPRRDFGGTYDEAWQQTRAPLWPKDVDPRIMCAAAPGLVARPLLEGGEEVRLAGVHPDGPIGFRLPSVVVQAKLEGRHGRQRYRMRLDAVWLRPDEGCFTLIWRTAASAEPDPLAIERIVVRRLEPWEVAV